MSVFLNCVLGVLVYILYLKLGEKQTYYKMLEEHIAEMEIKIKRLEGDK